MHEPHQFTGTLIADVPFSRESVPVASIIFVIVTCIMLLLFVVYFYRFRVQRVACAVCLQDMSRPNLVPDHKVDNAAVWSEKIVAPGSGLMLLKVEVPSPYRSDAGRVRPAGGSGDSDSGCCESITTGRSGSECEHLLPHPLLTLTQSSISISSNSCTSSSSGSGSKSLPVTGRLFQPVELNATAIQSSAQAQVQWMPDSR